MNYQLPPGPTLRIRVGIPLYIHWSVPAMGASISIFPLAAGPHGLGLLGALFMSFSIVLLVLIHELGHALAAMSFGSTITGIVLYFRGGLCFADAMPQSRLGRAVCICGGVIAQAIAFLLFVLAVWVFGPPTSYPLVCTTIIFLGLNPIVMLICAIPRGRNDGARLMEEIRTWR